ncbi:MAG: HAMP domain-containing protein, partial [Anaerolineales bacterium]|nr:HAMP domain-containing protein [Anaerolineales bacterium]
MKPISLRARLALWMVVVEALLLAVFTAVTVLILQNLQNQQIEDTLHLSASELNAVIDVRDGQYAAAVSETAVVRSRGVMAWILSLDGEVALTIGSADNADLPDSLPPSGQSGDGKLPDGEPARYFVTPLSEGSRQLGTLVLAIPVGDSQLFTQQMGLGLLIAVPIVLLLSILGGIFLAGRALQPVAAITHTAQKINAENLSHRLDLTLPEDEIGQLAQTFNAMLERIDRAFERERQLTSDVSHELRTPLGMLKTQLSLARSRPREAAALLQMMADMEGDVDRMTRLVEQMLTLARVEQRGLTQLEPLDCAQLLQEVVDELRLSAQEHDVTLQLTLPPQIGFFLLADSVCLRQVFVNLIENGIKYSPPGGVVGVTAVRHWQQISISVTNEGAGIPSENIPHLFERFYRVDDARARATGGFGLGLA